MRQAQARHRGGNQVLEDAVHRRRLGAELDADEDRRGDVEGQLLEGAEGQEAVAAAAPAREPARDHRVHALEVLAQRRARERLVHDLAVLLVLVAVAQQQAVGEDAAHDRPSTACRDGEDAVTVEQHEAVGIGPEEIDQLNSAERLRSTTGPFSSCMRCRRDSMSMRSLPPLKRPRTISQREARGTSAATVPPSASSASSGRDMAPN